MQKTNKENHQVGGAVNPDSQTYTDSVNAIHRSVQRQRIKYIT